MLIIIKGSVVFTCSCQLRTGSHTRSGSLLGLCPKIQEFCCENTGNGGGTSGFYQIYILMAPSSPFIMFIATIVTPWFLDFLLLKISLEPFLRNQEDGKIKKQILKY